MNIIIPIGGVGLRFQQEGYTRPKPLINVLGRSMIFHVIDGLKLSPDDTIHIIYNGDLDKYGFKDEIYHHNPKIKLFKIEQRTRGAAETVLVGLQQFNEIELNKRIVTVDCDTFYVYDVLNKFRGQTDNAVFCFVDTLDDPIYSYVSVQGHSLISDIKEKERISNYANTGCYCFESGKMLKEYCEKIMFDYENGIHAQKELFMSGVIKRMLDDKKVFRANIISEDDFHCLGTPFQVKVFCKEYCKQFTKDKKLRVCFDLDNTLVSYPEVPNDYSTVKPNMKTIRICRHLKSLGYYIIINTARRMKTYKGNVGMCIADIGFITLDTLKKFDIPCDELIFGKPHADFYIDDLAIDPRLDLERELGIYMTDIQERNFNHIVMKSDNIITKSGPAEKIKGEIHWYNNIPLSVKKLFPIMYTSSPVLDSYDMEKIMGVSMSYLHTTESVTDKRLLQYLEALERIHQSSICETNIDIYSNYVEKIKKRYMSYDYSKFPDSERIYNELVKYFEEYEKNKEGEITVVHGDPVFSNCIVNEYGQFKFIDMRGLQGDKETIFGDKWYDYGKVYQSLIGYDEILLDKPLSIDYRDKMIKTFEDFVVDKFGRKTMEKIEMITYSLLFTLIPLHHNEKCAKYFELIKL
jgi:capsule biosynthesis phosphatase